MRVCFLPRNIDGAGWYRCWFPAHYLRGRGYVAEAPGMRFFRQDGSEAQLVNGQLPDGWVNCQFGEWPDADVYVFQMPLEPEWIDMLGRLQAAGRKVVVELDDDYLHLPSYNPFRGGLTVREVRAKAQHLHRCVELADAVCVATPALAAGYRKLNRNVSVLGNRLYWPMWADVTPVYEQPWRKVRVGYMGRMEFHRADLNVVRPWFGDWLRENPGVEFVAAGDPSIHDFLGVPVGQRVCTDAVDFRHMELPYVTAVFDIGLVPLAENRFNEGKSYLKGLEYSACGIVPVASPTQQYRELLADGEDGFLARTRKGWVDALDALVADAELRRGMGEAARAKAMGWTYEAHIDEWESFYRGLCPEELLWGDGVDAVAAGPERAAA